MKQLINKLLLFTLVFVFGTACGDFDDLNVDPNEPTEIATANLVTQAMFRVADTYWSRDMNFEYAMLLVQHFAQDEYTEESRYNLGAADFDNGWFLFYASGLADLRTAKDRIVADASLSDAVRANQLAVVSIIESFAFQVVTDIWGDVPYSQALDPLTYEQPVYDDQSEIYSSLISTVSSAVSSITVGTNGFSASEDIIFGGDMDGWQKFGNALLLRMGMRIADVNSTLASSTVSAALAGNIIASTAEEANLIFLVNDDLANPFYVDAAAVGGNRDDFRITDVLLGTLQSMGDPRETLYADPTPTGTYVGMPYGLIDGDAFNLKGSTSRFHESIRAADAPAHLLRYSEVKFLEAEAIERGFVAGDAATAYNDGVTASMNEWGITDAIAIDDYLTANPYNATDWRASIGLQMWLALYTNGLEAWATWRRLDEPELVVPTDAFETYIPVRGLYPTDEDATNQSNMLSVGYDDEMDSRVWWDAN